MSCNCSKPLEERVKETKEKFLGKENVEFIIPGGADYVNTPCPCTGPGFCPHYKMSLVGRLWELSRMTNDLGKQYRQLWINMLNSNKK
jgi:hypothetical protein